MLNRIFYDSKSRFNLNVTEDSKLQFQNCWNEILNLNFKENTKHEVFFYADSNGCANITFNLVENCSIDFKAVLLNDDCNFNMVVNMYGAYSNINISTLSLAKNAKKNINIVVNHLAPESKSSVNNHGISFANGKIDYNIVGKINGKMQNANVSQITRGLILDSTGYCKAKPVLLIDYYDVKAYHGATIGKISDDDLFYLMSRGLTKNEAYMLIVNGIVHPYIDNIDLNLKDKITLTYQDFFKGE